MDDLKKIGLFALLAVLMLLGAIGECDDKKKQEQSLMQQQETEMRARQEAEIRAQQEAEAQRAFMSRFVGTFYFIDRNNNVNRKWAFGMLEDGRIIEFSEYVLDRGKYSASYIGNAYFLSQTAFTITGADVHKHIYFDGCQVYGWIPYNHPNYFYPNELIFDINENRVYISAAEYNNRDVAEATHFRFVHESNFPTIKNN